MIGQMVVYRGPHAGTAARVAVVVLGLGTFGCLISMAVLAVRRGRAGRPGSP